MDFRSLVVHGRPTIFAFGTSCGKKAAEFFSLIAEIEEVFCAFLNLNSPDDFDLAQSFPKNLMPVFYCLDGYANTVIPSFYEKINLFFEDPYKLDSDECLLHDGICRSKKTLCIDDAVRKAVQFRHSQFVGLMPQLPLPVISRKKINKQETYLFFVDSEGDLELVEKLKPHLGLEKIKVVKSRRLELNAVLQNESLEDDAAWNFNFPKAAIYVNNTNIKSVMLRPCDFVFSSVPVIHLYDRSVDLKSGVLPPGFIGSCGFSSNTDEENKELLGLLSNINASDFFRKNMLIAQRKIMSENSSLKNWMDLVNK